MIRLGSTLHAMNAGKPRVRIFTWIILAINILFLVWVIAGVASSSGDATGCGALDQKTCNDANDAGTAIGVFLIVIFWAAVDVILGIIWLVTRPRQVVYAPPPAAAAPAQGWYPDPRDPRVVRWWDGRQWTGQVAQASE